MGICVAHVAGVPRGSSTFSKSVSGDCHGQGGGEQREFGGREGEGVDPGGSNLHHNPMPSF